MNNNTIYKKYTLPKYQLFSLLLFTIIVFFFYFYIQFWILNTSLSTFHQVALLHILFILNILTIISITKRTQRTMEEIIFSSIIVNLNLKNKNINLSQKKEIKIESGFNFYITLTAKNTSNNIKKIEKSLKTPIEHLFKKFLYKESFYTAMAREHWYRIAYLTFLYFMLFILLLEMIDIGKKIFYINISENFHLLILLLIFSYFIIGRVKSIFSKIISIFFSIFFVYLYFIFQDYSIRFNQNYSILLMILSLFMLLFITSTLISVLKLNSYNIEVKEKKIYDFFLIDMYFNRTLLIPYETSKAPQKKDIMRELFYALIGFLFTISVPIVIEEVKTPSVIIEKNKGQTIERNR